MLKVKDFLYLYILKSTKLIKKLSTFLSLILFFVLTLNTTNVLGQKHEIGIMAGGSGFIGDVGETQGLSSLNELNFASGFFYRLNPDYYFSIRAMFTKGKMSADDLNSSETFKLNRGLHFSSTIHELSVVAEYNFFKFSKIRSNRKHFHTPYIFGGVAGFLFNPKAFNKNGEEFELQKLGTEGQLINGDKRYSLAQIAVPFGFGYKVNITKRLKVSAEFGWRLTFTDYLDDASGVYPEKDLLLQNNGNDAYYFSDPTGKANSGELRASSNNKDWYFFTGFILSYNFKQPSVRCPED